MSSKYWEWETNEKGCEQIKLKLVERSSRRLTTVLFKNEGSVLLVDQINKERHLKKGEKFSKSQR